MQDDEAIDEKIAASIRSGPFESMILETPHYDFDPSNLLQELTSTYIADDGAGGVALDPHALKKLFNTFKAMLLEMEAQSKENSSFLEKDAEAVEDEYKASLSMHKKTIEVLSRNLNVVDERFRKVTADAVRTGDSLNKKESQRLRAVDAIQLLEYFKTFDKLPDNFADNYDTMGAAMKKIPSVFVDEDRRMEAAHLLSRLRAISFELNAPGLTRAAGNMRAYSDFLEKELLDLFERAAGRQPPEADFMRECADILYALNEGDHLKGRYVYYVISKRLDKSDFSGQESLSSLFGKVISVCQTEFPLITKVFPPIMAPKVTRLLLQRILNDPVYGIQVRVEQVLCPPPPSDPLPLSDYLDCLATVEQQTWALFDLLKAQAKALAEIKSSYKHSEKVEMNENSSDFSSSLKSQSLMLIKYLDEQAKTMFLDHREKYPANEALHMLTSLLRLTESCWGGAVEPRGNKNTAPQSLTAFPLIHLNRINKLEQLLSGPLRPESVRQVISLSSDAVHRCRSILYDVEEREQKVSAIWTMDCNYIVGHLLLPSLKATTNLLPDSNYSASNALKATLAVIFDHLARIFFLGHSWGCSPCFAPQTNP
mmetsp:Transcript_6316/g.9453  ORF Transcript_6316/g.9453 Transcript_6316/m.9453 type:complete len:597 (-) Transcript_6316:737-2527(-)